MLTSLSDYPGYTEICRRAAEDDACFAGFRQDPTYSAVVTGNLHHQGDDYFALLQQRGFDLGFFDRLRDHDRIGGPLLRDYGPLRGVAPQTMRYAKTVSDLELLFGSLDGASIAEIGGGFGGQCAAIAKRFNIARYTLLDLDESLMLAKRYLDTLAIDKVDYVHLSRLKFNSKFDLVISCHALSEVARPVQVLYLQRVLLQSAAGYLLWNNAGMKQHKDWQLKYFGDEMLYTDDVLALVPGSRVAEPGWLTAEDAGAENQLIVWGDRPR